MYLITALVSASNSSKEPSSSKKSSATVIRIPLFAISLRILVAALIGNEVLDDAAK